MEPIPKQKTVYLFERMRLWHVSPSCKPHGLYQSLSEALQNFGLRWNAYKSQTNELETIRNQARTDREELRRFSDQLDTLTRNFTALETSCRNKEQTIQALENDKKRLKDELERLAESLKNETRARIDTSGQFNLLLRRAFAFDGLFGTGSRLYVADASAISMLRRQVPGWYASEKLKELKVEADKGNKNAQQDFIKVLCVFGDEMLGLGYTEPRRNAFLFQERRAQIRGVFPYKEDSNPSWSNRRNGEYIAPTAETDTVQKFWEVAKNFNWVHHNDDLAISTHMGQSENPYHGRYVTPHGLDGQTRN